MANLFDNLIDYLKPKAHSAIDSIIDLFKTNEEIQFKNLLKYADIKSDSKDANILKSYMEKAGMPYIKFGEDVWPTFKKGKKAQGEPDTLNVRPGNIDDFIEELAHAIQYNPRTKDGEYRDRLGSIRDSLKFYAYNQMKEYGDYRYIEPGTVEYQAHQEIAPSIWNELSDTFIEKFKRKPK